jgi:hypothetical protein
MTALTDTIEAAMRAVRYTEDRRGYAEAAAREVEPLIRAAEAAALERAAAAIDCDKCIRRGLCPGSYNCRSQWADDIRALPRDGSALDAVVAARTAGLREALERLDADSLDAIVEVIGEGEDFRRHNAGKAVMREWFLRRIDAALATLDPAP